MDRTVTIKFYHVTHGDGNRVRFSDALERIADRTLLDREYELEPGLVFRLENCRSEGGMVVGEIVRRQTENLPPEAIAGQPLRNLNAAGIGHSAVFCYCPRTSVIAFQVARIGVSVGRFMMYTGNVLGLSGFNALPVPTEEFWQSILNGRVRSISVKVSSPQNLEAIEDDFVTVRQSLAQLQSIAGSSSVEAVFSVGRGDEDLSSSRVARIFRWLLGERNEDRGGVKSLKAKIIDEDDVARVLSLVNCHLGESQVLEFNVDDPQVNFERRKRYVLEVFGRNRRIIDAEYAQQ